MVVRGENIGRGVRVMGMNIDSSIAKIGNLARGDLGGVIGKLKGSLLGRLVRHLTPNVINSFLDKLVYTSRLKKIETIASKLIKFPEETGGDQAKVTLVSKPMEAAEETEGHQAGVKLEVPPYKKMIEHVESIRTHFFRFSPRDNAPPKINERAQKLIGTLFTQQLKLEGMSEDAARFGGKLRGEGMSEDVARFGGKLRGEGMSEEFVQSNVVTLFDTINGKMSDTDRVDSFLALRENLPANEKKIFDFVMTKGQGLKRMGYQFKIGEKIVYDCLAIPSDDEQKKIHAKKIGLAVKETLAEFSAELTREKFIEGSIQCAVDGKEAQESIKGHLKESAYGYEKFKGIRDGKADGSTFVALFEEGLEIEFSNRISLKGEFRGDILKEALANNRYDNLGELFSLDYLTEKDMSLMYVLHPLKSRDEIFPNCIDPNDAVVLIGSMKDELAKIPVGNTTLDKIWLTDR